MRKNQWGVAQTEKKVFQTVIIKTGLYLLTVIHINTPLENKYAFLINPRSSLPLNECANIRELGIFWFAVITETGDKFNMSRL